MRRWLVVALTVACSLVAPAALACGTDEAAFGDDPFSGRPNVNNVNVSSTANTLIAQARQLEMRAQVLDNMAMERERRAQEQTVDARALRIEATSMEGGQRVRLLSAADTLMQQAAQNREQARRVREQSMSLRTQARLDRQRAVQLVSLQQGGGGWRGGGRPAPPPATRVDL